MIPHSVHSAWICFCVQRHMSAQPVQVKVHPTILLGIVDHFNRINPRHEGNRAVGMLLGTRENSNEGIIYDVSNYYAGMISPLTSSPLR